MKFNFNVFIEGLRENSEKRSLIEKYETFYGPIQGDIKDQVWFSSYAEKFRYIQYKIPDVMDEIDFDWPLLIQLVVSSFSSNGALELNEDNEDILPEFIIKVENHGKFVVKKIHELFGFQILRLFEIYIEEQMNLQILIAESEREKEAIEANRKMKSAEWQKIIESIKTEIELKIFFTELDNK